MDRGNTTSPSPLQQWNACPPARSMLLVVVVRGKSVNEVHQSGLVRCKLRNEQAQRSSSNDRWMRSDIVWLWAGHEDPRHTFGCPCTESTSLQSRVSSCGSTPNGVTCIARVVERIVASMLVANTLRGPVATSAIAAAAADAIDDRGRVIALDPHPRRRHCTHALALGMSKKMGKLARVITMHGGTSTSLGGRVCA